MWGLVQRRHRHPGPGPRRQQLSGWLSLFAVWHAQALFDLEATNAELKADLRDLYITSAKEVDVASGSRKAIIIHVSSRVRLRSVTGSNLLHAEHDTGSFLAGRGARTAAASRQSCQVARALLCALLPAP